MYEADQPKYLRVAQALRESIAQGAYRPGQTIPSEPQLAAEHGVSRPTVVRALELLKRDGWIESRQGYGTVVKDRDAGQGALDQLALAVENVLQAAGAVGPDRGAGLLARAREIAAQLDG
ncbi:helix-turn-helix DNA binding domain protein [Streptomyces phage Janus]|uniref:Helix-turn-helix DNA binding domain protein n=1 Tax=Streptomyces phage Janus TaxID=2510525 RepID=A0A411CQ50_9CAUD|nr:helix-turn-helix DNA-binding protein [Streptomyces phage Janus]QAY15906.1 helix-turn-helix DNA binding domain protein [Streptomyces phage Janus]